MEYKYIVNNNNRIIIRDELILSNQQILQAINFCNQALQKLDQETKQFDINIFEILGMRNLSGMVGEYFAKSVQRFSEGHLHSNLHQDGYPDLLLTNTRESLNYYASLYLEQNGKKYPSEKSLFSPFKYGGIEVKATCGNTPPASQSPKPLIGEQRIEKIISLDWKAHHRETNNLLAIVWDFINEVPTITACFYRNDLNMDDWGKIVQPRKDGGRTTSVSIMTAGGVRKMCEGWLAVIDMDAYIEAFSRQKWIGYKIKE